jgi:hypothetical protein
MRLRAQTLGEKGHHILDVRTASNQNADKVLGRLSQGHDSYLRIKVLLKFIEKCGDLQRVAVDLLVQWGSCHSKDVRPLLLKRKKKVHIIHPPHTERKLRQKANN